MVWKNVKYISSLFFFQYNENDKKFPHHKQRKIRDNTLGIRIYFRTIQKILSSTVTIELLFVTGRKIRNASDWARAKTK